jgi:hypothetical protein
MSSIFSVTPFLFENFVDNAAITTSYGDFQVFQQSFDIFSLCVDFPFNSLRLTLSPSNSTYVGLSLSPLCNSLKL